MEAYAGMLEAMDYHYGRVIKFLKDIGEYDNTVIIFLSDNGANPFYSNQYPGADEEGFQDMFDTRLDNIGNPGSNYAYGIGFGSSSGGPLDKFKLTVGEGGIRSPLLIAGPGIKSGQQSDAFAYVTDLMPTILELAGVDYPATFKGRKIEPMRGRSMAPLLDGTKKTIYKDTEFVGGEMNGDKWMRQGDFKAVMVSKPYGTAQWQLFNVVKDPGEAKDLSESMPEKLNELKAAWDRYAKEVGVVPAE
jgi:arylsulfatase